MTGDHPTSISCRLVCNRLKDDVDHAFVLLDGVFFQFPVTQRNGIFNVDNCLPRHGAGPNNIACNLFRITALMHRGMSLCR